MIVILEIALAAWAILFVSSFVIEFVWNRRPVLVAVLASFAGFVALLLWDWPALATPVGDAVSSIYASVALLGILPALVGAGLARFIRLWTSGEDGSEDSPVPGEE